MRRKLAAAVVVAGVLAAAGCSDGDGGGRSTAEVCEDIRQTVDPVDTQLNSAMMEAGAAAARGDEEALAAAGARFDTVVEQVTSAVREGAGQARDEEFSQALEEFATAMEGLREQVLSGNMPDLAALDAASTRVQSFCNEGGQPADSSEESGDE